MPSDPKIDIQDKNTSTPFPTEAKLLQLRLDTLTALEHNVPNCLQVQSRSVCQSFQSLMNRQWIAEPPLRHAR